jgi:dTDP-4-amino-4,6-dideoxygalactose transaminase/intein/homing endonuclease
MEAEEVKNVIECILSGWVTEGKYAKEFSRGLRQYLNMRFVTLCNSGSSANLLAVTAATQKELGDKRAKPGDEFITAAVGFPTTVSALIQNRITPVFVDIDPKTLTPDPELIEQAVVEGKTKGIILAHTLGSPFNVDAIRDICNEYGLMLIEDTCDALGSRYNGELVGTQGTMSTLSFFPAHHITMGQGGAVLTNDGLLKRLIDSLGAWGRSCFPAGTLVNVEERQVPIEQVSVGDRVLTHLGNKRVVTETMSREYSGRLYYIKPMNSLEVVCTAEHPFYVLRNGEFEWVNAEDLDVETDVLVEHLPIPCEDVYNSLSVHYQTMNGWQEYEAPFEPSLFRLIGYWLAEGSTLSGLKGKSGYSENKYKFYRVEFSFNESEVEYIDDVSELMTRYFGVSPMLRKVKKNDKSVSLSFKSRKAYEFFRQFFGTKAWEKSVPDWIVGLPSEYTQELLIGYWRGDGSSSTKNYSFSSSSPHLLNQVRRILGTLGVSCSPHIRQNDEHHHSIVNGKEIIQKHPAYWINIYGKSAEKFQEIIGENSYNPKASRNSHSWFDKNYGYHPIDTIGAEDVFGLTVHNLEVDGDHSYHANNIAVHNCWCKPGKDNTCGKRFDYCIGDNIEYDHKYIFDRLGYNLQITDLQAAIGVAQLAKVGKFEERRKDNWKKLREALDEFHRFFLLPEPLPNADPSWFGFHMTVKASAPFTRSEITQFLENRRIGTRMLFGGNLLHQPAFHHVPHKVFGTLLDSDALSRGAFWIGVHAGVDEARLNYIIETFREFGRKYA